MNLAQVCLSGRPDAEALVFVPAEGPCTRLTTEELSGRVAALAERIEEVSAPGDTVLIRLQHGVDFAAAFLAVIAAGRISVPLSPMLTAAEVQWIAHNSKTSCAIADHTLSFPEISIRRIEAGQTPDSSRIRFAEKRPESPAFLVYTSGTSGTPRGVLHAHRNIFGRRPMVEGWTGLCSTDRVFHSGMLNWTYTLGAGLMDPLREGACAVLAEPPKDLDGYLRILEEERITIFAAVPGLFRRILKYADFSRHNMSLLRHSLSAGSMLSRELYESWKNATGRDMFEALGMTEISTYISSGPHVPVRPGSIGKVQPGRQVWIIDPDSGNPVSSGQGVLAVHREDPGLMLGYWQNAEATSAAFRGDYFITGDFASMDADGYIHYEGRSDEMMNASGYRVSPVEIEQVLCLHEAVSEAACAEVEPPGSDITIVCAFIVLGPGFDESIRASILEFASGLLARYKMPKEIVFLQQLPRNANGKLLRKSLRMS